MGVVWFTIVILPCLWLWAVVGFAVAQMAIPLATYAYAIATAYVFSWATRN